MEALLEDRGQWVDKLVKDVAEQAKEKQQLNDNLVKYQIAIMVLFTAIFLMLVHFVQPWEDRDHLRAAHSTFDKFKGDDEKLNISELKLAFDSLVDQHQLPENTVGDLRRILESYDVHDAHADGGAVEFDEEEFTIAVNTENTLYGVLRQRVSSVLKTLFGWENVSLGNELRELKDWAGSPTLFLVGASLIVTSVYAESSDTVATLTIFLRGSQLHPAPHALWASFYLVPNAERVSDGAWTGLVLGIRLYARPGTPSGTTLRWTSPGVPRRRWRRRQNAG